ncbi:MAG: copper homeostasis protein [Lentimonas sp.]|jgi:copper homeostasis protein
MMTTMNFELCVSCVDGIQLAKKYLFTRIELCQNLEVGGLTPSIGLVDIALEEGIETHVLLRPRIGGFVYCENEFQQVLRNAELLSQRGLAGFVFGAITEDAKVDIDKMQRLKDVIGNRQLTFHRAFEDVKDWKKGVDDLQKIGCNRILTAGHSSTVDAGMIALPEIKEYCEGKIELMIGGGIHQNNIRDVLFNIKPDAIHFSASETVIDTSFSKFGATRLIISENKIQGLLAKVDREKAMA